MSDLGFLAAWDQPYAEILLINHHGFPQPHSAIKQLIFFCLKCTYWRELIAASQFLSFQSRIMILPDIKKKNPKISKHLSLCCDASSPRESTVPAPRADSSDLQQCLGRLPGDQLHKHSTWPLQPANPCLCKPKSLLCKQTPQINISGDCPN